MVGAFLLKGGPNLPITSLAAHKASSRFVLAGSIDLQTNVPSVLPEIIIL